MTEKIPMDQCKEGYLYRIDSRNLTFGIFREESKGFVGIREKFGSEYLFTEFHFDTGTPFGTVNPEEELEQCPLDDLGERNPELFEWMKQKEEQYCSED